MLFRIVLTIALLFIAAIAHADNKKETEARILQSSPVTYPAQARAQGLEGVAVLELNVDEKGEIKASRIAQSAGNPVLDDAALEWGKSLKLAPATRNGVAVASVKQVKVNFVLNGVDTDLAEIKREPDPAKRAQKFEDYAFNKLLTNAPFALCGQNAYLKCYAADYKQCSDQVNALKEDCFSQAKQAYPHSDASGSLADFSDLYFACISTHLADVRKADVENVRQCLGAENINNDKFMSDLQR